MEGQMRDINEGFPSDAVPHTEDYDYLSDSDLGDEPSCYEDEEPLEDDGTPEEDELAPPQGPDTRIHPRTTPGDPPQLFGEMGEHEANHQSVPSSY